jgi:hypothetical protein
MRRNVDQQRSFGPGIERVGLLARSKQALGELGVGGGQLVDEARVDARETLDVVEIREREAERRIEQRRPFRGHDVIEHASEA